MDANTLRRTKIYSLTDGAFWTLMVGFGETLVVLYLAKVCRNSTLLACMTTVPTAVGALSQAFSPKLFPGTTPRRILLGSVAVQIAGMLFMAIGLAMDPFATIPMLIGLLLYWGGGMCGGAPWQDMMANLIPEREHNRYFADRSALLSFVALACSLGVGLALRDRLDRVTVWIMLAFAIGFRMLSLLFIWLHPEPEMRRKKDVLVEAPHLAPPITLLGISLFMFTFRFSVTLSSPFFNPYMLNTLHFSVFTILAISAVPTLTRIFLMQNWGTLLDQRRTFEGIMICIVGTSILPSLWALSSNVSYIALLQLVSGVVWAGFELLGVLLVQRMFPHAILGTFAVYLAAGTAGAALGGIAGGRLLDSGMNHETLFHLSSHLRALTGFILLMHLHRVRAFRFRDLRLRESVATLLSVRGSVVNLAKAFALFKP